MPNKKNLAANLSAALNASNGERKAAAFLKKHPEIVLWPFYHGSHCQYVLHEFKLGINHKPDFVVLTAYSGMWHIVFVELEPVSDPLVTKSGRPTKVLNGAISQLGDWRDYIERNRPALHRDLAAWCKKKDLLKWNTRTEPSNMTGDLLKDSEISVRFEFAIVIGRRAAMTPERWRKVNQYRRDLDSEIRTYDAFLDIAHKLDGYAADPNKSVNFLEVEV
jgi:hypothetical protein